MKEDYLDASKIKFKFDKDILDYKYTAHYFIKTCDVIRTYASDHSVIMQFTHFSNMPIMVCGVNEVLSLLEYAFSKKELNQLKIRYIPDGTVIKPKEALLTIEGPYELFGWLENVIDGILARRCSVATNCYYVNHYLKDDQQVIYMSDRSDDYRLQPYDGYAAAVGGMKYFVTRKQVELLENTNWKYKVIGSMPHALIQQNNGRVDLACQMFLNRYPNDRLIALIDYNNNVINDLESLREMFSKIYAVRIDTSKNLVDESLLATIDNQRNMNLNGCNPYLVQLVRDFLDQNNASHIKIVVSSGITLEDVKNYNKQNSAIDYFGIGSYLNHLSIHITADLVYLDNIPQAKKGRKLAKNYDEMQIYK